ncbi:MAG: WD40/YVTN/BNR-like repeat-containing protein [Acidimicrobiales bacterium]
MTSLMSARTERLDKGGNAGQEPTARLGFRARLTDHLSVAVGTEQGLFAIRDGETDGPYFSGCEVSAFLQIGDRCYAGAASATDDPVVYVSQDRGLTWNLGEPIRVAFPEGSGRAVDRVTQLQVDNSTGPPTSGAPSEDLRPAILATSDPAALFRSLDDGNTFDLAYDFCAGGDSSTDSQRPIAVLHSLLTHRARPGRIVVGILGAGVFRSGDGGATFQASNGDLPAEGAYVSRIALDPSYPDRLWARTGAGTYRSDDAGDSWAPAAPGTVGGHDDGPVVGAALGWSEVTESVPHAGANYAVLGEAFTAGEDSPFPLAFGTQAGEVFASLDGGITWRRTASGLPPVLCVRVLG